MAYILATIAAFVHEHGAWWACGVRVAIVKDLVVAAVTTHTPLRALWRRRPTIDGRIDNTFTAVTAQLVKGDVWTAATTAPVTNLLAQMRLTVELLTTHLGANVRFARLIFAIGTTYHGACVPTTGHLSFALTRTLRYAIVGGELATYDRDRVDMAAALDVDLDGAGRTGCHVTRLRAHVTTG